MLPELDKEFSPIPFTHTFFVVEFEMNPIYIIHQKIELKHWLLDIMANLGGMIVFSYLFFGFFCQTIPRRLYEAHVIREVYRVKFNKFLKGLKLNKSETFREVLKRRAKQRRKEKRRKEQEKKALEMAALAEAEKGQNQDQEAENMEEHESSDEPSLNSEQREAEKNKKRREEEEEKELDQSMEQVNFEGGDTTPRSPSPKGDVTPRDDGKSARSVNAKSPLISKQDKSRDRS